MIVPPRRPAALVTLILALLTGLALPRAAAHAQQGGDLSATWAGFTRAYESKDWDDAIELVKRLIELQPENPVHPYNAACCHALKGESAAALEWLARAAEAGFSDARQAATDPDLAALRSRSEYVRALDQIRANAERAGGAFRELAAASPTRVVLPPDYDISRPAPVVVALHPFGGTAEWIVDRWRRAAAELGVVIVAPQGVRRVEGRGYQWGPHEEADHLLERALRVVDRLAVDRRRIVLTGFSQGGAMTYALGARHADRFCGLIPVAGRFESIIAGPEAQRGGQPRLCILVGGEDRVVEGNRRAAAVFRAAGRAVELHEYPGVGHAFPPDADRELVHALRFVLRESDAPVRGH